MKRIVCLVLSLVMIMSVAATTVTAGSMSNFKKSRTYTAGQFSDVSSSAWYAGNVKTVYETGLMNGNSNTTFNPEGDVSHAETVALACRLHSIYNGTNPDFAASGDEYWFDPYYDYAAEHGIWEGGYGSIYNANVECIRLDFVYIIAAAIPESEFEQINNIAEIPDMQEFYEGTGEPVYPELYRFYRAGILTGSDKYGMFHPFTFISRSEVAAILSRIIDKTQRKKVELEEYTGGYFEPIHEQSKLPYPAG